jgi:magnesium dechelatase
MPEFTPSKLHVKFNPELDSQGSPIPRCYTLTHSDLTGDLFLTIATTYDQEKISGWYTRLMRDEVLGEWKDPEEPKLHIHCHVSGGFVLGPAKWRLSIFKQHLPMVLHALCFGDIDFIKKNEPFSQAPILVHFHAKQAELDTIEPWGSIHDFLPG